MRHGKKNPPPGIGGSQRPFERGLQAPLSASRPNADICGAIMLMVRLPASIPRFGGSL
jgi:hypothetical protein